MTRRAAIYLGFIILVFAVLAISLVWGSAQGKSGNTPADGPVWVPGISDQVNTEIPIPVDNSDGHPVAELDSENSIIMVSDPIDTANFTDQPVITGWEVGEDPEAPDAIVVTIVLSKADWSIFAQQAGIDESIIPARLQLGEETAQSLVSLDELADKVNQHRVERKQSPVDIRTLEYRFFDLEVSEW